MRASRSVSLVVPMRNEERSLPHLLDVALDALPRHAADWEIVLVDDAPPTARSPWPRRAPLAEPRIRVVRHAANRGLGGALKSGFAAASKEWVLYSDCDLPWDLDETGRVFRAAELTGADVVSGYRHDRTGEGTLRTIYSFLYNGLVHLAFDFPIRDVNFSCKLIRRRLLDGPAARERRLLHRRRAPRAAPQPGSASSSRSASTTSRGRAASPPFPRRARSSGSSATSPRLAPALRAERRRLSR